MKRVGTVLTFAPGVSAAVAARALQKFVEDNPNLLAKDWIAENETMRKVGINVEFRVQEYDDRLGGPVWYIP